MCANWKNGYDPDNLADRLEAVKSVKEDGNVSFHGFGFTEYIVVLISMVSVNDTIPEFEKNNFVRKAAFNLAKKQKITSAGLLAEICRFETEYLEQKPQKYVLISTLSIHPSCKLKRAQVNDCTITFHSTLPEQFTKEIETKIKKPASYAIIGDYPQDYLYVKTTTAGKSYTQAASKAIDSIDIIRAIWNLYYNRGKFRISSGKNDPVNNIVFGPIHTIHFPSGKLASESWFYETGYLGPLKAFDLTAIPDMAIRRGNLG